MLMNLVMKTLVCHHRCNQHGSDSGASPASGGTGGKEKGFEPLGWGRSVVTTVFLARSDAASGRAAPRRAAHTTPLIERFALARAPKGEDCAAGRSALRDARGRAIARSALEANA